MSKSVKQRTKQKHMKRQINQIKILTLTNFPILTLIHLPLVSIPFIFIATLLQEISLCFFFFRFNFGDFLAGIPYVHCFYSSTKSIKKKRKKQKIKNNKKRMAPRVVSSVSGPVPGRFGQEILVCQFTDMANSQGYIWSGGNPFSFTVPVLLAQLALILTLSRVLFLLLQPLKQSMLSAQLIVSSCLCYCSFHFFSRVGGVGWGWESWHSEFQKGLFF